MINFDELLKLINLNKLNQDQQIFSSDDSSYDIYMESFYDSLLSSIINKAKNDAGDYDMLNKIKNIKKDISNETKKQYKIIISFCKESEIPNIKAALKKYNFLHFLKFVIRITDVDEEYNLKVNECKKYFSDPETIKIYQYLYNHGKVPLLELKPLTNKDLSLISRSSTVYDLIISTEENNTTVFSLSPKGINLYAFFMMKDITIDSIDANYNESKVNEVLEYLIQYLLTQSNKDRQKLKKPLLNSSSANYNLYKLTSLLDSENSYSQDFIQFSSDQESESYNWMGGKPWKTY